MDKYYNIHNILTFKVVDNAGIGAKLLNGWDIELRGFESNQPNDVDFIISIGKFNPDHDDCTILDNDYYIKEDYLYCRHDSHKHARWQMEIAGFERGDMIVHIHPNLLGKLFIPELLINPLICPLTVTSAMLLMVFKRVKSSSTVDHCS